MQTRKNSQAGCRLSRIFDAVCVKFCPKDAILSCEDKFYFRVNRERGAEMEENAEITSVQEDVNSVENAPETQEANENTDTADTSDADTARRRQNFLGDLAEMFETALITVFIVLMIFTYLLHPVSVKGRSMNNTLYNGDRIVMNTVYGHLKYGDIVVVDNDMSYLVNPDGSVYEQDITGSSLKECIIKRVIAVGGQTIDIRSKGLNEDDIEEFEVSVDGKVLDEPYIFENIRSFGAAFNFPFTVPEGYYFVMGDNRNNSADSRNPHIGLIKQSQVLGVAIARYYPSDRFTILLGSKDKVPEEFTNADDE